MLLDLEGESLEVGAKLKALNSQGKAKAILEVKQVKENKAVANILKGTMQTEYTVQKVSSAKNNSEASTKPKGHSAWGFTGGYAMNSMTVKPSGTSSISLSGSSFNASGFYQMAVEGRVSSRILVGYETLQAKGTSSSNACTGSSNCTVDISYLGLEALVRYSFYRSNSFDVWAGAGLGFLFALGKSSNVLDTSKITTNQTIVGSLGMDYRLSRDHFVPVQLDYALFPDNSTSSANQIILRAGYGFSF
ncbi:MAG: hypothetical protein ACXVCA_18780 [Bdellovibrio sp.]